MKIAIDKYILLLIGIVLLSACYEDQEGCLDYLAANYDVIADEECLDCCIYPELTIQLTQKVDTLGFSLGDTITNNDGQRVRLLGLVYLISNVAIVLDGELMSPVDSAFLDIGDTILVRDNFARISRSKATYDIGDIRTPGLVSAISFNIGLPEYIVDGSRFLSGTENDVTVDPDSLISDDLSYTVQRIQIGQGFELSDTLIYDVPSSLGPLEVYVELETMFVAGEQKIIPLAVDYKKWLEDIDFDADSPEIIADKMRTNLAASFSLD